MTYNFCDCSCRSRTTLFTILTAFALIAAPSAAQDNPFEGFGEPMADEDAAFDEPPDEFADEATVEEPAEEIGRAERPAAAAAAADARADYASRDPAVAAVLELPRETPAEKFRAVTMLIDLGHPDVAAIVLAELLQAPIDDSQRAALVREFGAARFMQLIRLDQPNQPGPLAGLRAFAQAALDAAAAQASDPARINALIAQLNAPTEEERYAARVDLRGTGAPGMIATFSALAAAETKEARANLMLALAEMRPAVNEPLLAVLADGQGTPRRDAAELAGYLQLEEAIPLLAAVVVSDDADAAAAARAALSKLGMPAPSAGEAQTLLRKRLAGVRTDPVPLSADGLTGVWWSWNPETNQLASVSYPLPQLHALSAARLSRALRTAGGSIDPATARLMVLYGLEEAALLSRPPGEELARATAAMSPADLSAALETATKNGFTAAAVELIAELGRRGDLSILATSDGQPSPLAAAMKSPERAVRFAALSAILQLAPPHSFPGASYVADSLWYFIAGAGQPTAVVASPDIVQASIWAGELRGLGYEATPVRTGREALLAAIDPGISSRLAIVVLDSDTGEPLIGEVVYQLRTASRTAGVPVLIASSVPRLSAAQRIAANDPLVLAAPRPHGNGALAMLVERTIALTGRPLAPAEQRTAQAQQALTWLAELLRSNAPYDELERDAALVNRTLLVPELSGPSIAVLAALGTKESQIALLDYASSLTRPIEARRAAAAAFAESAGRNGLRIGREKVLRQYDRYNASETADAATQQVLGGILDAIEKKPQT